MPVAIEPSDLGQVIDLINGHIEDYAEEIAESFKRHAGILQIGFKVKLSEVEGNLGVEVGIEFDQEPKPKKPEVLLAPIKNRLHVVVEKTQRRLFE